MDDSSTLYAEERRQCDLLIDKILSSSSVSMSEQLEAAKLLHYLIVHLMPKEEDGDDETKMTTTTTTNISPQVDNFKEEMTKLGDVYMRKMLQWLRNGPFSLATATLLLNLLAIIVRERPIATLPIIVPAMMELWERHSSSSGTSSNILDPRSFLHALRLLLSTVTSLPQAEKYCPMIDEALKTPVAIGITSEPREKRARVSKGPSTSSTTGLDEEPEDTTKADDLERIQLRGSLDITRLPPDILADLLISTLPCLNEDRLPVMLGKWRPSAMPSSTATTMMTSAMGSAAATTAMADPRKKRQAPIEQEGAIPTVTEVTFSGPELQSLVIDSLMRSFQNDAGMCPEHLALLTVRLMSLFQERAMIETDWVDETLFGGILQCIRQFIKQTGEEQCKKTFLASWLRALWYFHSTTSSNDAMYEKAQRWLFLNLLLQEKPHWLPWMVDQSPTLSVSLVLECVEALSNIDDSSFPVKPEALIVDLLTTAVLSRQGRTLSEFWSALTNCLQPQRIADTNVPMVTTTTSSTASTSSVYAIDALCKLYAHNIGQSEIEHLADVHKELWYGLLRVNPALLFTTTSRAVNWVEERDAISRSLNKCPKLTLFIQQHLYDYDLRIWLQILTTFISPRTVPAVVPWLATEIVDGRLDGCFGVFCLLGPKDLFLSTTESRDGNIPKDDLIPSLWPHILASFLTSDLVFVLASPLSPSGPSSKSTITEEERIRVITKWAGRLVEQQWLTVSDLLIQLHVREVDLGGDKPASQLIQALMSQPAWKAPLVLSATLTSLTEIQPVPVLFYKTLLTCINSSLLTKSAVLSALVKSFKSRPWGDEQQAYLHHPNWEGILRVIRAALPESAVAALQLPMIQLRQCLQAIPQLKLPMRDYLNQQPPSYRNRFRDIFPLLANK